MKLAFGSQQVAVTEGTKIKIRSDGKFTAYEQLPTEDGELQSVGIYGPRSSHDRFTVFTCHTGFFMVDAESDVMWGYETIHGKHENTDTTPLEITADMDRPLTLKEEMKRFIVGEMSRAAESQDQGSFEDEDDFDIEDDVDPTSPYELTEMQEEYLEQPPTPPETPPQAPPQPADEAPEDNPPEPTTPQAETPPPA